MAGADRQDGKGSVGMFLLSAVLAALLRVQDRHGETRAGAEYEFIYTHLGGEGDVLTQSGIR